MDEAVARGGSILVVCRPRSARMPVVRGTLDAAGQARRQVADDQGASGSSGARDALNAGDNDKHDRLIAEQSAAAGDFDTDRARA